MWLVAETVDGNYLEYYKQGSGKPSCSIECDNSSIEVLEILKSLLNTSKAKPRHKE